MNRLTPLFLYILLVLWTSGNAKKGPNTCHPKRTPPNVAANGCQGVKMPPNICLKCRLRPIGNDGYFKDCTNIYNINNACKAELQQYVNLNKCDDKRKKQLKGIGKLSNRRYMDFFLYAVCEQCCDCIPFGAKPGQYNKRKKKLTQLERGNCPAHAFYDICKLWPNIRDVVPPFKKPQLWRPKACPMLRQWRRSPASKNWKTKTVKFNGTIKRFLGVLLSVTKCKAKQFWEECTNLEFKQKRI